MDKTNDALRRGETLNVLDAALKAWGAGAALRKTRARNKNFTYGRQLEDRVIMPDGRMGTEWEAIVASGKEPLTNNMIRQLVKSVVGRYRTIAKDSNAGGNEMLQQVYSDNMIYELDSRMLEEFLISGCCVQRVDRSVRLNRECVAVDNVNLNHFFINSISDPRGWDCKIVGQLHDMTIAEIIMRLSDGNREKGAWIRGLYAENVSSRICTIQSLLGADNEGGTDFWNCRDEKSRVIEVWTLESREIIKCHDYNSGEWYILPAEEQSEVDKENTRRAKSHLPMIEAQWSIRQVWHCRWISPMGDLLDEYDSPYSHGRHPFIVKMYPLTDGEVHAFVEDVIDQQKYVNRLITLVDHIMNVSAKGVLLYPSDSLPSGFTWDDIKRMWSSPNGIIPYETGKNNLPKQISTNATNIGAYELLSLEMKLFEEISGVSGALQGKQTSGITGARLYEKQSENAMISLYDIYETFASFTTQRDMAISQL